MNKKPYILCFCEDCRMDFLVKQFKQPKLFCPKCGESIAVQRVKKLWIEREYGYKSLWTEEEDKQMVKLLVEGKSYPEIAESLKGRSVGAIRRRLGRLRESGQIFN
jgi:hypothetical protein